MSMNRILGRRAVLLTKFITDRAQDAKANCVLIGASALRIRGVITRKTKDLDFNITPRKSVDLQEAIRPHLERAKKEGVLVDGKTPEAKAAQTKFRIYKKVEDSDPDSDNIKVDFSENSCATIPDAYTEVEGIHVATVPLMVIFKICAIARQNRATWSEKLVNDVNDLVDAVHHLKDHGEIVPAKILGLLDEEPGFDWVKFWESFVKVDLLYAVDDFDRMLHDIGISKTGSRNQA